MKTNKKPKLIFHPISLLIIMIILTILLSSFLSMLNTQASYSKINSITGELETILVTPFNLLSLEGLKYILGNAIFNFVNFTPLTMLIVSLFGISIAEKSGIFTATFSKLKKISPVIITFILFVVSILSTVLMDYGYVLLIPLAAILYKNIGRKPTLGIIVAFAGITFGYGVNVIFTYNDSLLGYYTEIAALLIDTKFVLVHNAELFIGIVSTIVLSLAGTYITEKMVAPKMGAYKKEETEEIIAVSNIGLIASNIVFVILVAILFWLILPNSGILLDLQESNYINQLFSSNSTFGNSYPLIISIILIICSFVYGKFAKTLNNPDDIAETLGSSFQGFGKIIGIVFIAAQLIAIFKKSNIGVMAASGLTSVLTTLDFSGLPLIILFFFFVIIISILNPIDNVKWSIMSASTVPLFMKSNITPEFTTFIFKAGDAIGKSLTPLFSYFIILLAYLKKYSDEKVTIFGTIKLLLPYTLILTLIWLLILIGWYIVGLPLGPNILPSL